MRLFERGQRGLRIVVEILPTLVGLMMASGGFSGPPAFDLLGHLDRTRHRRWDFRHS